MGANSNIKTFAFLDLETTGLPHEEYNKTKVTELCLIGVKRRDIAAGSHPRVQQKINFCFYPERMVSLESERLTGLSNDLLEHEPRFKKRTGDLINDFLDLLEKPVCLVAHHGDNFDYPILKAEMHKAGSLLGDDLLCVDSLKAFMQLYEEEAAAVMISEMPSATDNYEELGFISVKRCADAQTMNETTPPRKVKTPKYQKSVPESVDDLYYCGETREERRGPPARKQLHFGRPSFKLADLYERLTKRAPLRSHRAEEDVLMLIACASSLGPRFAAWADGNAVKLSVVPMMTPGRKVGT